MTASSLGELGIIKLFRKIAVIHQKYDDVSTLDLGNDKLGVLKADMFVDKTDRPPGMNFKQVGMKALTISVSDFAAKGIKPSAALIAFAAHPHRKKYELESIAQGLKVSSKEYNVPILGGDTNESSDLIITSILFGICKKDDIVFRRGAKPGDLVVTSGRFGLVSSGLIMLLQKQFAPPKIKRKILNSVYRPKARIAFGNKLRLLRATSSIDSSDGLALSLHQLSEASKVGFLIERMPLAKDAQIYAEINKLDPFELVFYGGEEYEIVATLDSKHYNRIPEKLKRDVTVIGKVIKDRTITYVENRTERKIKAKGWEHFKSSS